MQTRTRILASAACALAVAGSFVGYANEVDGEARRVRDEAVARYGGEVIQVAVAQDALEAGVVVGAGDVSMRDWLVDLAPEDPVTELDGCVGRTLTVPVAAGSPLTALNFRDATQTTDVPSGHVAVTIPVSDKLGISREVAPGSAVVAYETASDGTRLLAGNATVLAAPGISAGLGTGAATMTLALMPADVAKVLAASSSGELRLVLPADDVIELDAGDPEPAPTTVEPVQEGDS